MDRYDYEFEWDDKYCYPNSYILKNKLNITDSILLMEAERKSVRDILYNVIQLHPILCLYWSKKTRQRNGLKIMNLI